MRLIDAELLLDDMKKELEKASEEDLTSDEAMVIMTSAIALKDFVTRQPTVDAVPVVRCKDCRHCDPANRHCDHCLGTALPLARKADDFCSYGEKMDGDKE